MSRRKETRSRLPNFPLRTGAKNQESVTKYTFYAVEQQKISPWLSLVPSSTALLINNDTQ